jgi:hypothetical protein
MELKMLDLNNADPQREFDIIPAGTVAELAVKVRPGNAGDDGRLRTSKDGHSEGLDLELTVTTGEHAKRKLWTLFTLDGKTDGHVEAARISASKIRAMLESARGVMPDDESDTAKAARKLNHFGELNGLRFLARIGVNPARNGFKAKNMLDVVITPNMTDWHTVEQVAKESAAPAATAASPATPAPTIAKPTWAKS